VKCALFWCLLGGALALVQAKGQQPLTLEERTEAGDPVFICCCGLAYICICILLLHIYIYI